MRDDFDPTTAQPVPAIDDFDPGTAVEMRGPVASAARRFGGRVVQGAGQILQDAGVDSAAALTQQGRDIVARNPNYATSIEELAQRPVAGTAEILGDTATQVGAAALLAKAGGVIGSRFGPAGRALGQAAGATAALALPTYGGIRDGQAENGIEDIPRAAFFTGMSAAAERLGLEAVAGKLLNKGATRAANESIGKAAAKGAASGALVEAPTEVIQTGMERLGAGNRLDGEGAAGEYLYSGVAGAIGGAGIGAGLGALTPRAADVPAEKQEQREADAEVIASEAMKPDAGPLTKAVAKNPEGTTLNPASDLSIADEFEEQYRRAEQEHAEQERWQKRFDREVKAGEARAKARTKRETMEREDFSDTRGLPAPEIDSTFPQAKAAYEQDAARFADERGLPEPEQAMRGDDGVTRLPSSGGAIPLPGDAAGFIRDEYGQSEEQARANMDERAKRIVGDRSGEEKTQAIIDEKERREAVEAARRRNLGEGQPEEIRDPDTNEPFRSHPGARAYLRKLGDAQDRYEVTRLDKGQFVLTRKKDSADDGQGENGGAGVTGDGAEAGGNGIGADAGARAGLGDGNGHAGIQSVHAEPDDGSVGGSEAVTGNPLGAGPEAGSVGDPAGAGAGQRVAGTDGDPDAHVSDQPLNTETREATQAATKGADAAPPTLVAGDEAGNQQTQAQQPVPAGQSKRQQFYDPKDVDTNLLPEGYDKSVTSLRAAARMLMVPSHRIEKKKRAELKDIVDKAAADFDARPQEMEGLASRVGNVSVGDAIAVDSHRIETQADTDFVVKRIWVHKNESGAVSVSLHGVYRKDGKEERWGERGASYRGELIDGKVRLTDVYSDDPHKLRDVFVSKDGTPAGRLKSQKPADSQPAEDRKVYREVDTGEGTRAQIIGLRNGKYAVRQYDKDSAETIGSVRMFDTLAAAQENFSERMPASKPANDGALDTIDKIKAALSDVEDKLNAQGMVTDARLEERARKLREMLAAEQKSPPKPNENGTYSNDDAETFSFKPTDKGIKADATIRVLQVEGGKWVSSSGWSHRSGNMDGSGSPLFARPKYDSRDEAIAAAARNISERQRKLANVDDSLINDSQRAAAIEIAEWAESLAGISPPPAVNEKQPPNAEPPPSPEAAKSEPKVSANTVFTEDAAEKARALLKSKLGQLNSGIDPEMMQAGITLAGYHIEKGARTFAAYAKAMVDDLGDMVKPYLKSWYMGVKYDPRAAGFDGMDDAATVESADVDAVVKTQKAAQNENAPAQEQANGITAQSENEVAQAPVDVPASDGPRTESERVDGGVDSQPSQAGDGANRPTDAAGVPAPRSGGNRAQREGVSGTGGRRGNRGLGSRGTGADGAGVSPGGSPAAEPTNLTPAVDFEIDSEVELGEGAQSRKFNDNIEAIRLVKKLKAEKRRATAAEAKTLARYVGWGGMPNAFADRLTGETKKGWDSRAAELAELLTESELERARASSLNAHYTSETVVRAMWDALKHLGFKGGLALEPSMGTGNFLGLMPGDMRGRTKFIGVELDNITADIASYLYPQQTVLNSGLQNVPLPLNEFDLVIGNPPFGKESLNFNMVPAAAGKSIHNQFFIAGMEALKPGGVQAMVVSRYFMDAKDNSTRSYLAQNSNFLGAIRLPDTAFKQNAMTEVVTDIIFLQKREIFGDPENAPKHGTGWDAALNTVEIADPLGGDPITVNQHFASRRDMVLGTIERSGKMQYKGSVTVKPSSSMSIADGLAQAVSKLPQLKVMQMTHAIDRSIARHQSMSDALEIALQGREPGSLQIAADGSIEQVFERETPAGEFELAKRTITEDSPWHETIQQASDGRWFREVVKTDERGKPVKKEGTRFNEYTREYFANESRIPTAMRLGKTSYNRLKQLVELRDLTRTQLQLESQGESDGKIEANRKRLKAAYTSYTQKNGPVNDAKSKKLLWTMPDGALVTALESKYRPALTAARASRRGEKPRPASAEMAAILSGRVARPYTPAKTAESPEDALAINLSESGRIDIDRIGELLGMDSEQVIDTLHTQAKEPFIYLDPETQEWVDKNQYLSGEVRRKLRAAEQAGMLKNIEALEKVQPEPWGPENVAPVLGAGWIPTSYYSQFANELTGGEYDVKFYPLTNSFSVHELKAGPRSKDAATSRVDFRTLFEKVLNSQAPKVYDTIDERQVLNEEQTSLAVLKARELTVQFQGHEKVAEDQGWIFQDTARRNELTQLFNDKFNTRVTRQHDGSHLTFPGKVPDSVIGLRRHQKNAVWRGITERFLLLDHVVGAGKTYTAIARAMERRRMGLSQKPMIVVPNHLVEQFGADVYKLYPGAKVLAASSKDFEKKRRRQLFAKIATGDWDVVIVPHSSFGFIGVSPETERRYLQSELNDAMQAVKDAQEQAEAEGETQGWRKPFGVKEAERLVSSIETRMQKLESARRDKLLTFEQLGVDDLTVDEAHEFKNLYYSSRLSSVRGMGDKLGSKKAKDLYNKVRVISENPRGSVVFMTGTPISNSAVEMFTMMRYLSATKLVDEGIDHFDAFHKNYTVVTTAFEPNESNSLSEVNRLGPKWKNMRSLMGLYYSFTDAVSLDDIKTWYAQDNDGKPFPTPEMEGGTRQIVEVETTEAQDSVLKEVVDGFASLSSMSDPKQRNAERLRLMDRARKVSLDVRAVDPKLTEEPGKGKIGAVVDNAFSIYNEWKDDKGTQLIFLDRSTPKARGDDSILKKYDQLVAKRDEALRKGDDDAVAALSDKLDQFNISEVEAMRSAAAGGWNAYQEIKDQLIAKGVPANEIRFIHDANNDQQKQELFDAVKDGDVRVLIGSTARMGAGTNVQDRLVALHHLDVDWKPSSVEQREGRIIRQDNKLLAKYGHDKFKVKVLAYATKRTIDAKMWGLNATKLKMVLGIRKYNGEFEMDFDDSDSVNFAEISAIASGDPLMLERVTLGAEIEQLELLSRAFVSRRYAAQNELQSLHSRIEQNPERIRKLQELLPDLDKAEAARDADKPSVKINGQSVTSYNVALNAIREVAEAAKESGDKFAIKLDDKPFTSRTGADDYVHVNLGDESKFLVTLGDTRYRSRAHYRAALAAQLEEMRAANEDSRKVGSYGAFDLHLTLDRPLNSNRDEFAVVYENASGDIIASDHGSAERNKPITGVQTRSLSESLDPRGALDSQSVRATIKRLGEQVEQAKSEITNVERRLNESFPMQQELSTKQRRLEWLVSKLAGGNPGEWSDDDNAAGTAAPAPLETRTVLVKPTVALSWYQHLGQQRTPLPGIRKRIASKMGFDVDAKHQLTDELPDSTPMAYDPANNVILVNRKHYANSPATMSGIQLAEEMLHAFDTMNGARLSADSRFHAGGSVHNEARALYESGDMFWRYPFGYDDVRNNPDRLAAEVFARAGVLYFGNAESLRRSMPAAYEVFDAIFGQTNGSPVRRVQQDVRGQRDAGRDAQTRQPDRQTAQPGRAGEEGNRPGREDFRGRAAQLHVRAREVLNASESGGNNTGLLETRITPELRAALDKAGMSEIGIPVREAIKQSISKEWEHQKKTLGKRIEEGLFNRFAPLRDAEKGINVPTGESAYVAARLSTGASSTVTALLTFGQGQWKDGIIQKVEGTKGLLEALEPVRGHLDAWAAWMVARRAEYLMQQGKENNLTPDDIAALKKMATDAGLESRTLERVASDVRDFNTSVLRIAEGAGLLTPDQVAAFSRDRYYIPFYRVDENEDAMTPYVKRGLSHQASGIKALKGGKMALNDPLANMMGNISRLVDASLKNRAASLAVTNIPQHFHRLGDADRKDGKNVIRVMLNGESAHFAVSDPAVMRAMAGFSPDSWAKLIALPRKAKSLLTSAVTADPSFIIRNFMRDTLQTWAVSNGEFTPLVDSIRGIKSSFRKDPETQAIMYAGASFLGGGAFGGDYDSMADTLRRAMARKGFPKDAWETVALGPRWWQKYRELGEAVENANRSAVYHSIMAKHPEDVAKAIFESKDLMDFSLQGSWAAIRLISDMVPFFNARLQGLYKLGRSMDQKQMYYAGTAIAVASLLLLALNHEDERWKALTDEDKDLFWHFFVGNTHFRIPKPFEVGMLFGTVPERLGMAMLGENAELTKRGAWMLLNTFSMDVRPQLIKPLSEVMNNKDSFRNAPIDNLSDLNKLPGARYDLYTSEAMKHLGESLGVSPKRLEHLWQGYFGTLGGYALSAVDGLIKWSQPGEHPNMRMRDYPVLGSFARSGDPLATRYARDMYDTLREAEQVYRTVKDYAQEGRMQDATRLAEEGSKLLAARKPLRKEADRMRRLRERIEIISLDPNLDGAEKRRRISHIERMLHATAKRASEMAALTET